MMGQAALWLMSTVALLVGLCRMLLSHRDAASNIYPAVLEEKRKPMTRTVAERAAFDPDLVDIGELRPEFQDGELVWLHDVERPAPDLDAVVESAEKLQAEIDRRRGTRIGVDGKRYEVISELEGGHGSVIEVPVDDSGWLNLHPYTWIKMDKEAR